MEMNFILSFSIILALGLFHAIPFYFFWKWALKRGLATLRLFAVGIGLITLSLGVIFWLGVKEVWILILSSILGISNSIVILTLPITSPAFMRKLKIRW